MTMMKNYNNNIIDGITNGNGMVAVRIIPNFTRYIIYSDGRVFNRERETWLNENKDKRTTYATITMKNDNNVKVTQSVHKLIYTTFIGEIPEGKQINHKDENRRNNLILFNKQGELVYSNLEVVTPQ